MKKNKVLQFWLRQFIDLSLAFGISVFVTYFYMGNPLFRSFGTMLTQSMYGFTVGISIWKVSQAAGYYVEKKFPCERNPGMVFKVHLIAAIACAAFTIIFVNWIYHDFIYK